MYLVVKGCVPLMAIPAPSGDDDDVLTAELWEDGKSRG